MKVISQFFREDLQEIPEHERNLRFVLRPLQDLHDLIDDPDTHLAAPVPVHLRGSSPEETLLAYPVQQGGWSSDLVQALRLWVREETISAVDTRHGRPRDAKRLSTVRDGLAKELDRCLDSCTFSSQGRFLSSIFWLYLSQHTARELGKVPRLVLERDRGLGRQTADKIKYEVFHRLSVLVNEGNLEVNRRIVGEVGKRGAEFLSRLVLNMRDNELIFTEEYVDPDLQRLTSYLTGSLGLDPDRFLKRLARTREFALRMARKDPVIRQALDSFYGIDIDEADANRLFFEDRLTELVFQHPKYSRRKYFGDKEQKQFRELSRRLRAFELLHMLRRRILRVRERSDGHFQAKVAGRYLIISRDTATIDFSKPGAMENLVYRHGLMYDIRDFTATLEKLRRQGMQREKVAIKHMFLFHELLYELQCQYHLSLEKFLGDGAFYTGMSPMGLLAAAVKIQDLYGDLRRRGFVFDQGIRIALNYAYYNLLPIRGAEAGRGEYVLEYHGPGLVELNRLTTGKSRAEVREFKELLMGHGYEPGRVHEFFEPMESNPAIERRDGEFGASLDEYGTLVNEGIVASRPFIQRLSEDLGRSPELREVTIRGHLFTGYVRENRLYAIRELGQARLKGMDPQRVYEIDTLEGSAVEAASDVEGRSLLEELDRAYRKNQARTG